MLWDETSPTSARDIPRFTQD